MDSILLTKFLDHNLELLGGFRGLMSLQMKNPLGTRDDLIAVDKKIGKRKILISRLVDSSTQGRWKEGGGRSSSRGLESDFDGSQSDCETVETDVK
jgi:hypothetical protein